MAQSPSPSSRFDVKVEKRGGRIVVRPCGELDMVTAPRLEGILRDLSARNASVMIDLGQLEFIDSTGIRLIWDVNAQAARDGLDLALQPGPPEVMKVFELTGLTRRLPFAE